jgi:hypothetical protein
MSGGRRVSSACRIGKLRLRIKGELDLLGGLLLEGGDGLLDRRVLLGGVALVPPHDEVGGPGAERRQDQRCSEDDGSTEHSGNSLKYWSYAPCRACARPRWKTSVWTGAVDRLG